MSRRPLAPEVWEQALINGRSVSPSDDTAALAFAEQWYLDQGGAFIDEAGADPFDALIPSEEPAAAVEPEPVAEPEAEPEPVAIEPTAEQRSHRRRRAHRTDNGQYIADNPATEEVNEAYAADNG